MKYFCLLLMLVSFFALSDEPAWVINPEASGYPVAIVGSAMPQKMGEKAQYRMAEMSARQEFSANKSVYIKSAHRAYEDSVGNSDSNTNTYLNSSGLINFSALSKVKEWKDPVTKELFLLYAVGN